MKLGWILNERNPVDFEDDYIIFSTLRDDLIISYFYQVIWIEIKNGENRYVGFKRQKNEYFLNSFW